MTDDALSRCTIEELTALFETRQVSPVDVTEACLTRIQNLNGRLAAYITVLADSARAQAKAAEHELMHGGARGPLHGIPLSVKDVYETAGVPTTWGARALSEFRPANDATVVARLRMAGAILLGKTNVDMYPYDGDRDTPRLVGPTRNPWDIARTAGRSSGGSGAAVAACLDYGSVGSDTGGSIRIPAACCGIVGLKPTFGLVSNYGAFPYSQTLDCGGPLTRSVHDCAVVLGAIAGFDPNDSTTMRRDLPDYTTRLDEPVRGLRVGVPGAARKGNAPDVTWAFDQAVGVLSELGMEVQETDLTHQSHAQWALVASVLESIEIGEALLPPPASSNVYATYLSARNVSGRKRLLRLTSRIAEAARGAYQETFRTVDLLVTPTLPVTAPRFVDTTSPWQLSEEAFGELLTRYTRIVSFTGHPAISVPCGTANDRMPIGLQIIGRPFEEETVLRAAHAYERKVGGIQSPLVAPS